MGSLGLVVQKLCRRVRTRSEATLVGEQRRRVGIVVGPVEHHDVAYPRDDRGAEIRGESRHLLVLLLVGTNEANLDQLVSVEGAVGLGDDAGSEAPLSQLNGGVQVVGQAPQMPSLRASEFIVHGESLSPSDLEHEAQQPESREEQQAWLGLERHRRHQHRRPDPGCDHTDHYAEKSECQEASRDAAQDEDQGAPGLTFDRQQGQDLGHHQKTQRKARDTGSQLLSEDREQDSEETAGRRDDPEHNAFEIDGKRCRQLPADEKPQGAERQPEHAAAEEKEEESSQNEERDTDWVPLR